MGVAALAVLAGFAFWRLLFWIKSSPVHPDPWDAALEQAVQADDAVPVCHRCLTPAPPGQWFCETCGTAVGPYNNLMPYVNLFSEGEVLRSGVTDRVRLNALTVTGYVLLSLGFLAFTPVFLLLAPVYWFSVFKNLFSRPAEDGTTVSEIGAG